MTLPAEVAHQTACHGLRSLAGCGGCAAKADPQLVSMLAGLAGSYGLADPAVLAGLTPFDDAAVYRLDAERALVASVDFFPPLVDDPDDYGAIAAANAISDLYAMGADITFALVISGFPSEVPEHSVAAATTAAARVVSECGGQVLGGHSIRCAEPVFGLCVFGFVHPQQIWRKSGAQPGDSVVLSKPLGTGVLLARGSKSSLNTAVAAMRRTNRSAAAALAAVTPHAVTDVTGYGLLGHSLEMAERSDVRLRLRAADMPLLPGALSAAQAGARTSADGRTRAALADRVVLPPDLPVAMGRLLYDPQTSGGLLAAVSPSRVLELKGRGFCPIGVIERGPAQVVVE